MKARIAISHTSFRTSMVALALVVVIATPAAARRPLVGLGDQNAAMFTDPAFMKLGIKYSRLLIAWDWHRDPLGTAQVDEWMAGANAAGVRPLIAFGRNWRRNGDRYLPSRRQYLASFRAFRTRYPGVREFTAWNEANHTAQPTARKPRAAARYYKALRRACRRCTIVAADVLDSRDMVSWVRRFRRYAPSARLWGLHNYKDANDARGTTRELLRAVRGKVWLTETGGILRLKPHASSRGNGRKHTKREQAAAVRRVYRIARSNRRITRIYFYEWKQNPASRWDSAFLDADGRLRPAYHALRRGL